MHFEASSLCKSLVFGSAESSDLLLAAHDQKTFRVKWIRNSPHGHKTKDIQIFVKVKVALQVIWQKFNLSPQQQKRSNVGHDSFLRVQFLSPTLLLYLSLDHKSGSVAYLFECSVVTTNDRHSSERHCVTKMIHLLLNSGIE